MGKHAARNQYLFNTYETEHQQFSESIIQQMTQLHALLPDSLEKLLADTSKQLEKSCGIAPLPVQPLVERYRKYVETLFHVYNFKDEMNEGFQPIAGLHQDALNQDERLDTDHAHFAMHHKLKVAQQKRLNENRRRAEQEINLCVTQYKALCQSYLEAHQALENQKNDLASDLVGGSNALKDPLIALKNTVEWRLRTRLKPHQYAMALFLDAEQLKTANAFLRIDRLDEVLIYNRIISAVNDTLAAFVLYQGTTLPSLQKNVLVDVYNKVASANTDNQMQLIDYKKQHPLYFFIPAYYRLKSACKQSGSNMAAYRSLFLVRGLNTDSGTAQLLTDMPTLLSTLNTLSEQRAACPFYNVLKRKQLDKQIAWLTSQMLVLDQHQRLSRLPAEGKSTFDLLKEKLSGALTLLNNGCATHKSLDVGVASAIQSFNALATVKVALKEIEALNKLTVDPAQKVNTLREQLVAIKIPDPIYHRLPNLADLQVQTNQARSPLVAPPATEGVKNVDSLVAYTAYTSPQPQPQAQSLDELLALSPHSPDKKAKKKTGFNVSALFSPVK